MRARAVGGIRVACGMPRGRSKTEEIPPGTGAAKDLSGGQREQSFCRGMEVASRMPYSVGGIRGQLGSLIRIVTNVHRPCQGVDHLICAKIAIGKDLCAMLHSFGT